MIFLTSNFRKQKELFPRRTCHFLGVIMKLVCGCEHFFFLLQSKFMKTQNFPDLRNNTLLIKIGISLFDWFTFLIWFKNFPHACDADDRNKKPQTVAFKHKFIPFIYLYVCDGRGGDECFFMCMRIRGQLRESLLCPPHGYQGPSDFVLSAFTH